MLCSILALACELYCMEIHEFLLEKDRMCPTIIPISLGPTFDAF
jgi:hypothetical protein